MAAGSQESCHSIQFTWPLITTEFFRLLHLSPSAPTRETVACLDRKDLSLITWQSVTSSSQPSLRVNFAIHLTLLSWEKNPPNQENQMDFSFCWTQARSNKMPLRRMLRAPRKVSILPRSSFTHLNSSLHLVRDLMEWMFWKEWPEQKALSNFPLTRRNALFTTERNARLRSTWIKFRGSAIVLGGLWRLTRTKIRWKVNISYGFLLKVLSSCGPEKESCVANQTLKDKSCSVPCTGLYADIWDSSQYLVKGKILMFAVIQYVIRSPHVDTEAEPWGGVEGKWI